MNSRVMVNIYNASVNKYKLLKIFLFKILVKLTCLRQPG